MNKSNLVALFFLMPIFRSGSYKSAVTLFCAASLALPNATLSAYAMSEPPPPLPSAAPPSVKRIELEQNNPAEQIDLNEFKAQTAVEKIARAQTEDIAPERLKELAAMLPPLKTDDDEKFQPPKTLTDAPPKPNAKEQVFPPQNGLSNSTERAQAKIRVLTVTRISRKGSQSSPVSDLTVAFNQPVVAVADNGSTDAIKPIQMVPAVPGVWHWINTTTIQFKPRDKFLPNATTYKVTVPAGTTSVFGAKSEKLFSATFDTPAPAASDCSAMDDAKGPLSGTNQSPILQIFFDQKIVSSSAVNFVKAKVGKILYPLRLATAAEISSEPRIDASFKTGQQVLFLKPVQPFPKNSTVNITILPGIASQEGPNKSKSASTFTVETCKPMKLLASSAYIHRGDTVRVRFTNSIKEKSKRAELFTISPPVNNFHVNFADEFEAAITGDFKYNTRYQVHVSKELKDEFGQSLTGTANFSVTQKLLRPSVRDGRPGYEVMVPSTKPVYHVYTINESEFRVEIFEANKSDWNIYSFEQYDSGRKAQFDKSFSKLKKVFSRNFKGLTSADDWRDTPIDMSDLVKNGASHFIVVVDAPGEVKNDSYALARWIDYTPLKLIVRADKRSAIALVSNTVTGLPVPNASVRFLPSKISSQTDQNGLCRISIPNQRQEAVQCDFENQSTISLNPSGFERAQNYDNQLIAYGNTDRQLYRPGEKVHVVGILRKRNFERDENLEIPQNSFKWKASTGGFSDAKVIAQGSVMPDKFGSFAFDIDVPQNIDLNTYEVKLGDGELLLTTFKVQEFRRPEFEVDLSKDKDETTLGDPVKLRLKASYRSGGALNGSVVRWKATSRASSFTSARFPEFVYCGREGYVGSTDPNHKENNATATLNGATDKDGVDEVKLTVAKLAQLEPIELKVSATTVDLNQQDWTQDSQFIVHPSDYYVGLSRDAQYNTSKPFNVNYIVVDQSGNAVPDCAVHLALSKLEISDAGESRVETEKIVVTDDVKSETKQAQHAFKFPDGGQYFLTATVTDKKGRINRTRIEMLVQDYDPKEKESQPSSEATGEKKPEDVLQVTADGDEYEPGDTARISIQSPVPEGHGMLLVERESVLDVVPLTVKEHSAKISLKIRNTFAPGCKIYAIVLGSNARIYQGDQALTVKTDRLDLHLVAVAGEKSYQPGKSVGVKFTLRDSSGKPVPEARIAIAVVDEALLALTNYAWKNPLETFFEIPTHYDQTLYYLPTMNVDDKKPSREDYLNDGVRYEPSPSSQELSSLPPPSALPPPPLPSMSGGQGRPGSAADSFGETAQPHVTVRSDFSALAYFNPKIVTDKDGCASANFNLPGNLTSYKIMAIATKDVDQFGSGESKFQASLPIQVRPSLPRFLNFEDYSELPFVVQNNDNKAVKCELVVRPSNADHITGCSFEIPANDRVQVKVPVSANYTGKEIQIQAAVVTSTASDATDSFIPVNQPVTTESFATYGQIDQGADAQIINVPTAAFANIGGLKITTSSTAMTETVDAAEYLVDYPFECSEQLSAKVLGLGAITELGTKFKTLSEGQKSLYKKLQQHAIDEICKRQQSDGGFGLWKLKEKEKYPYVSIQCVRALHEAKKHGIAVPENALAAGKSYLESIESDIDSAYSSTERASLRAFALNTRFHMGDSNPDEARRILNDALKAYDKKQAKIGNTNSASADLQSSLPKALSPEAMGWLLPVLLVGTTGGKESTAIEQFFSSHISETASTANFEGDVYAGNQYLLFYSRNRMNSVILDGLTQGKPTSDLIPKLVKGLLLSRKNGCWNSTQENAFALLALANYFEKYEKVEPDFTAQFWLGKGLSFEQKFVGRSSDECDLKIPMEYLQDQPANTVLTIAKQGAGRLYYRVGMSYAPADLKLPAESRGFHVERTFIPIDNPSDVTRDAKGVWQIKAGAAVRVKVKFNAPGMRYHVALTDPISAGCEIVNGELEGSRSDFDGSSTGGHADAYEFFWPTSWFDHQNLRDKQAEAFTSLLYSGDYEYSYVIHATTTGSYIVPPTKVEEMYAPETYGRTATDFMEIK